MDYLQIEYFVQVAKTQNISTAANILNVSQSSLSQTIKRLENELGTQLFDRKGKHIYLNENGKRFLTHASDSLDELNRAKNAVSGNDASEVKGHIVIGMFAPISLIIDCLSSYVKKYLFVNFTINSIIGRENSPATQESDFLIGYDIIEHPSHTNGLALAKSNRYFVIPEKSKNAKGQPASIKDIVAHDFVSLIPSQGGNEIGFIRLAEKGYYPNIRFKTNDSGIKRAILENGIAAGFTNEYINKDLKQTGDFYVEANLRELGGFDIVMLFWREERNLSKAARSFLEYIKNWYNI